MLALEVLENGAWGPRSQKKRLQEARNDLVCQRLTRCIM